MEELLLENKVVESIDYPWIVFESSKSLYSLSSKNISSIVNLPEAITKTPQSAPFMRGIITLRGLSIPLVDLRVLFGKNPLDQEISEFKEMLEARKKDHLNWVGKFEDCANNETAITVGSDCRACAFGKWYYSYNNDNNHVMHCLKRIEDPHFKLHNSVNELNDARLIVDAKDRKKLVNSLVHKVKNEFCASVVKGIDDSFEALKDSFRELVLVVDGDSPFGIIVDSVIGVDALTSITEKAQLDQYKLTNYVKGIANSKDGIIIMLNENVIRANVLNS